MNRKNLLYFSAFVLIIALFSLLSDFFLLLVHGASQAVFEGNSIGKTLVMLFWFFFLPLISFACIKFNLYKKLQPFSKKLLFFFLAFAVLGYFLGLLQFSLIAAEFQSFGPFATIAEKDGVLSWQASKLSHNHFPKASLYVVESFLGLNLKGFDDGFPWYSFISDPELWAFFYLLIEAVILFAGILYINSRIKEISFFDFLVFSAGLLAVLISVLDGGVASGAAMMAIFFITLYLSKNYLKIENRALATLLPLMVIGFIGFADVVVPLEIGNNFYASAIILFFGLSYYFFSEKKAGRLNFSLLNIVLALIFFSSLFITAEEYLEFSFGREIQPGYLALTFQEKPENAGIFVYGLPAELGKEKVDAKVKAFGEILESDKAGWSYYALIQPERNFRTGELEVLLQKKFSSDSYLYVEQVTPMKKIESYKILWFTDDFNSDDLLREEFLASKIIRKTDNLEEKSTEIVLEEKTPYLWQMLSVLSEIRNNGFEGKVLVIKKS